jgi:hypothetical protein
MVSFAQECVLDSAQFKTADAGCKDLTTGLVWSKVSATTRQWEDAVWGGVTPAADANDDVANDYGPQAWCGTYCDTASYTSYCKSLVESGASDWRLPTLTELTQIVTPGKFNTNVNTHASNLWAADTYWLSSSYAWLVHASTAVNTTVFKRGASTSATAFSAICVRSAPVEVLPNQICKVEDSSFKTQDGGCKDQVNGFVWSTPAEAMHWEQAVWAGNNKDQYDLVDNDFDGGCTGLYCDSGKSNSYCHELVEGGKYDWRLPSILELATLVGKAGTYLNGSFNAWYHTGASYGLNTSYHYVANPQTGALATVQKRDVINTATERQVICVRGGI